MTRKWPSLLLVSIAFSVLPGCTDVAMQSDENDVRLKAIHALEAWISEDWKEMYSVLSRKDKSLTSEAAFISERERLAKSRKLLSYSIHEIVHFEDEISVSVVMTIRGDYNSRIDDSLDDKIETVSANWRFVDDGDEFALTFLH